MISSKDHGRIPLDIFLISGHMHMGAGASSSLMHLLQHHPAVRSYGMVTYHNPEGYDVQSLGYIRDGRVNTLFIDPGNTGDPFGFDAAPYIDRIRKECRIQWDIFVPIKEQKSLLKLSTAN